MNWKSFTLTLCLLGLAAVTMALNGPATAAQPDDPTPTPTDPPLASFIDEDTESSPVNEEIIAESQTRFAADRPTLIYFYADWCIYCAEQTPILETMASELNAVYDYQIVDVDDRESRNLIRIYGVSAIPHVVILDRNREVVGDFIGITNERTLTRTIRSAAITLNGLVPSDDEEAALDFVR
jgi:thioredoxin-like negative regulator of GroEL